MDIMLRWSRPGTRVPEPPPEVRAEGHYRAGVGCCQLLWEDPRTKGIPVVTWSVVEREDWGSKMGPLPPNALVIPKSSNLDEVVRGIRAALPVLPPERGKSWWEKLGESIEAKPEWFGFSVDLKKLLARREHRANKSIESDK